MKRKSVFGLNAEQLDRLLSVGTDGDGPAEGEAREPHGDSAEADGSTRAPASLAAVVEQPGGWVGRYRLLSVLGEGGMGIVYLAQQTEPIQRQVALKVIKPGMDSKRVIARFEAERQALALLDQPNIAHIYDAGTSEAGRPYFVMEYVEGLPITDYCDKHSLTIEQRLRLFQQVCEAVQHAHQKGIIHRDIKPSNILVATDGDNAIPKIIDFGVAKAIAEPLTERTLKTEDSHLLGTPEYMSPEQADMASEDIDTRSDIYSLGVLLYVLLTGTLPFDTKALREHGIEHVRKTIRESDPKTPSTQLTKLGDAAKLVAKNRCTQVGTLARRLRSELDWIPLKAMRKERSERYRSASELADDIENYLRGVPLLAGPLGPLYRVKKFLRRHAALSAAALAVAVALVLGLAGMTVMYVRAERASAREASARIDAERALAEAQAVSDFLLEDILSAERFPEVQELGLNSVLDFAAEGLEGRFENQPLLEASIRNTLGQRYLGIRKPELAREHLERAYEIRLQHLAPEKMIRSTNALCWAYRDLGRHEDAIRIWTEQIEVLGRAYGETYGWRMLFMHNIGETYTVLGQYEEAETWFDEVLKLCARSSSPRRFFVLFVTRWHQGVNYTRQKRYEEAEQALKAALEAERGGTERRTLACRARLAEVYHGQGRHDESQQLYETTLDTMRQVLADEHSTTLETMCGLGSLLMDRGLFAEAQELIQEALEAQRRRLGDDDEATLTSMHQLAVLHVRQARYEQAEPLLLEAFHGRETTLGPQHPHTVDSLKQLVILYESWDKPDEAAKWRSELARRGDAEQ